MTFSRYGSMVLPLIRNDSLRLYHLYVYQKEDYLITSCSNIQSPS